MKQLARTALYWPKMDSEIMDLCRKCHICAQHQNAPPKTAIHPWTIPEKPWNRVHLDHAINFMGYNWQVMVDSYSKYPCIHAMKSITTKATIEKLEEDFSHFGYPLSIVTDNAPTFISAEFKQYCQDRGIIHLTGAPYHPSTNGAAERLVQTFKQAIRKSERDPKEATVEFLMQYRRSPVANGYSPSQLLNNRQLRTKIDTLVPSPTHLLQGKQSNETNKANSRLRRTADTSYKVGAPCYALYCGQIHHNKPR